MNSIAGDSVYDDDNLARREARPHEAANRDTADGKLMRYLLRALSTRLTFRDRFVIISRVQTFTVSNFAPFVL